MTEKINGISDDAVYKATGKHWDDWIKVLNDAGAYKWPHKEIAQWLNKNHINSSWWCQCVTVAYEYAIGRRVLGETADAGFEVGVQRTFNMDVDASWQLMVSPEALKIWLGTDDVNLEKGATYITPAGTEGEIRTVDAGNKLRLRWQPKGWNNMTTLQMTLLSKGGKTAINFHQEKLESAKQRQAIKQHWEEVLEKLKIVLNK